MRFFVGVIVGVALTLGAAFFHDNNLPARPRSLADQPIVNWAALGAVAHDWTTAVGGWWDGLMGRSPPAPPGPPAR